MSLKRIASLTALFVIAGTFNCLFGQGGDPNSDLEHKLADTFKVTTVTADRSGIVAAGAVVVLQKPGLLMYAVSDALAPSNTYKNGKISQGWAGFGKDLLTTSLMAGGGSTNDVPKHTAAVGEKFWVVGISANKGLVQFAIYSDPDANGIRYWAELKFPFDKKSVPGADVALQSISEVLALDNQAPNPQPEQPPATPNNNSAQSSTPTYNGTYLRKDKPSDSMMLGESGVFALVQNGKAYGGHYTVEGDVLTIWGPQIPGRQKCRLAGSVITDPGGTIWEKPPEAQNTASSGTETAGTNSAATPMAALPPPPPPADAPAPAPPTLSMGQTIDQVIAIIGQPTSVAKAGTKTIFNYSDLKVTFANGKVSDIQ